MTANAALSPILSQLKPEHLRLIALRIEGKSWSKCALHLGVDRKTVTRWRADYPEIDQAVLEESFDEIVASRHRMAALHDAADDSIQESLTAMKTIVAGEAAIEVPDYAIRLSAAKMVKSQFEKLPPPQAAESAPPIHAGGRDESSRGRILDASVEDDDFSDLNLPDRREEAR